MFQFAGFPPPRLWIRRGVTGVFPAGFPHSGIRGSLDICSSPRLFAACRAFHRLLVPRHPPCALCCLTRCFPLQLSPASAPSVALPWVFPDFSSGSFGFRIHETAPVRPWYPRLPAADIFLCLFLDVRWSLLHRLVLFSSVFGFQGTVWRLLPPMDSGGFGPLSASPRLIARFLRNATFLASRVLYGFLCCSGGHLLSHAVSSVVPSAACGLTIVFGMGTGIPLRRIATGTSLSALDRPTAM